jgi:hypothetical protein
MAPSVPPPPSPDQAQTQAQARRTGRAAPAHQQRAVAALLLSVLSLFGLLGVSNFQRGVYIVGFALVAGVLASWLAATALARTRQAGTAGPRGSVTAIVIGGIGVLLSGLLLLGFALFGTQASTFSRCLSGANTLAAQQACKNQFIHSIKQVTP